MSQIAKIENQTAGLSLAAQKVELAMQSPLVKELDIDQLTMLATNCIAIARTFLGQRKAITTDSPEAKNQADEEVAAVAEILISRFPGLRSKEITLAVKQAVTGGLNLAQPLIFSPSNFALWLQKYNEVYKRTTMVEIEQLRAKELAKNEQELPSLEQQKQYLLDLAQKHKKELENNQAYDFGGFPCGPLYTSLEELGIFAFDKETKSVIKDKAIEELSKQQNMDFAMRKIKKITDFTDEQIKAKARHIAWTWYVLNEI